MPDRRQHRGPHPQDETIFRSRDHQKLLDATGDLNWLLSRGYGSNSSVKLVGDRYGLTARQRLAVGRCACSDDQMLARQQKRVDISGLQQQELWIDGYNALTSIEAALSGGVILHARDGCYRDMASMHGSYRKVQETMPAIRLIGELTLQWKVAHCRWILDQPVSNSGRLKTMLRELAEQEEWDWDAQLVSDADPVLMESGQIVASADSQILDGAQSWFNLAREVIESRISEAWILDLSG